MFRTLRPEVAPEMMIDHHSIDLQIFSIPSTPFGIELALGDFQEETQIIIWNCGSRIWRVGSFCDVVMSRFRVRCLAGNGTGQRLRACEAPGVLCPFLESLRPSHDARFSVDPSTMDIQVQEKCRICQTRWRHSECTVRYSRFDSSVTETSFQRFRSSAEKHAH